MVPCGGQRIWSSCPFGSRSTVWRGSEKMGTLELGVPGGYYVVNALAVMAVADELELPITEALRPVWLISRE